MKPSEPFVAALTHWTETFLQHRMRTMFMHSRKHGLSVSQMAALLMIHRKGISNVSDIGDELEITNPAASQLLERLVQQGLVARSEDPNDRRLKQISISKHGEAILREGLHARQKWLESLAECMSSEEQEQVAAALNILVEKVLLLEQEAALEP